MLQLIHQNGRMIVTDIYVKMRMEQPVASQHLAILRRERILKSEREGKYIFYSLNYQRIREMEAISDELLQIVGLQKHELETKQPKLVQPKIKRKNMLLMEVKRVLG